jgi:hypothetical protein
MLDTLLKLLPAVGPVAAALPEFAALIEKFKDTLSSDDADELQRAYDLAQQDSDEAHVSLQTLVASRS